MRKMINTDMDSASSRRSFLAKGLAAVTVAAEPGVTTDTNAAHSHDPAATSLHARIARANLVYDKPVTRSEEGMPLGNGRHGTLVWTTPTQVCLQINRVDVYGNDCRTNSFFERTTTTAEDVRTLRLISAVQQRRFLARILFTKN
jgi:hypothetical protein